jgi:glycosyltransferase involved in cell wall biosynthesis
MRILVLTFFYPPDLSAGSFRSHAVVKSLCARPEISLSDSGVVEVLTTQPNRYKSFRRQALAVEDTGRLTVRRFAVPPHAGGLQDQARSFLAYARAVEQHVKHRKYNAVFATSSRLMTAVLGARVARVLGAPLYLDIRDIFVDTIGDVFRGPLTPLTVAGFSAVERFAIAAADHVNLVSEGFEGYFAERYPGLRCSFLPNGIDDEFLAAPRASAATADRAVGGPLRLVYAGNFGAGQALHAIVPDLANRLGSRATFTLIGDGGQKAVLEASLRRAGATTVTILPPMDRAALIESYRTADVLFLHLNDLDAFAKVLPSKIFEYAAMGRPILAGVRGFAADFLYREVPNVAVFPPGDAAAAVRAIESLDLADTSRDAFIKKYSRQRISGEIAAGIVSLATGRTLMSMEASG